MAVEELEFVNILKNKRVKLTLKTASYFGVVQRINPEKTVTLTDVVDVKDGRKFPGVKLFFGHEIVNVEFCGETNAIKGEISIPESEGILNVEEFQPYKKNIICGNDDDDGDEYVNFQVIDEFNEKFGPAVMHIKKQHVIGVAADGVESFQHGRLCWLQIATKNRVYLFDILLLGAQAFKNGLSMILQSQRMLKVVHDCRGVASSLLAQFGVNLTNVFDTQVADVMCFHSETGGYLPDRVSTLQEVVSMYLKVPSSSLSSLRMKSQLSKEEREMWYARPCPLPLLKAMALGVIHLQPLRVVLLDAMMTEYLGRVDSYLSNSLTEPGAVGHITMSSVLELPRELRELDNLRKDRQRHALDCFSLSQRGLLERFHPCAKNPPEATPQSKTPPITTPQTLPITTPQTPPITTPPSQTPPITMPQTLSITTPLTLPITTPPSQTPPITTSLTLSITTPLTLPMTMPPSQTPPITTPQTPPITTPLTLPMTTPRSQTPPKTMSLFQTPPTITLPSQAPPIPKPVSLTPPITKPLSQTPPIPKPMSQTPPITKPLSQTPPIPKPVSLTPPITKPLSQTPPIPKPVSLTPPITKPLSQTPPITMPLSQTPPITTPLFKTRPPGLVASWDPMSLIQADAPNNVPHVEPPPIARAFSFLSMEAPASCPQLTRGSSLQSTALTPAGLAARPPPAALGLAPPPAALGLAPPPAALGLAPPHAVLGLAPPPAVLGLAPPPAVLGLAPPPAVLGLAPPPVVLGLAPPHAVLGLAPPPVVLGLAPPPAVLGLAPPPAVLGLAPPHAVLGLAPPPAVLCLAPPPAVLGLAPPPVVLGLAPPHAVLGLAPPPVVLGLAPPHAVLGLAPPPAVLGLAPPPGVLGPAPPPALAPRPSLLSPSNPGMRELMPGLIGRGRPLSEAPQTPPVALPSFGRGFGLQKSLASSPVPQDGLLPWASMDNQTAGLRAAGVLHGHTTGLGRGLLNTSISPLSPPLSQSFASFRKM